MNRILLLPALALLTCLTIVRPAAGASATENTERRAELQKLSSRIHYQTGTVSLQEGTARLALSDGFRYIDPAGTETVLNGIWGNPPSDSKPLGMVVPASFDPFSESAWCVVLRYQADGYVKDDDAGKIDYTNLLKEMQAGVREASAERVKSGYPSIDLVGWATPPRYDRETHKFYWAKELKFGDSPDQNTLNYNLRVLGRSGILELNVVSPMSQLAEVEKATPDLLSMVEFTDGNRYADYKPGYDKVAAYGLAALVAGGVAAKAGLFKGLLVAILAMKKFIVIGVLAVVAAVRKFFAKSA
jgi:uncharacterized membrane-anchored protein